MRATGKLIWQMVKVDLYMLMVIYILDTGRMTKLMARVFIHMPTARSTMVCGKMISSRDMVLRHGLMELSIKEIMLKVKSTATVILLGLIGMNTKVISLTITYKAMGFTTGVMVIAS
jgi:hypothetical protein